MRSVVGKRWVVLSAIWASILVIGCALLMAAHESPLLGQPLANPTETGRWTVTHVLTEGCPCSRAVAAHLQRQGRLDADVVESVVVIGTNEAAQGAMAAGLQAAGFAVLRLNSQQAWEVLGVNGGPMLLVDGRDGKRVYRGGYVGVRPTSGVDEDAYRDREIIDRCRRGERVPELPALGCSAGSSASEVLRDVLAPLSKTK